MKIVTSGYKYIDIDAYAGCIAYAELLQKQGFEARAISDSPLNESITPTIRSWGGALETQYIGTEHDTFVLIDVSDPSHFDGFVDIPRVEQVIDHHPGFEKYWSDKIGNNARIEFIGAACTQVYELWKAASKLNQISKLSAQLLVCGILDNTLNFGAKITTERDKAAYADLLKLSGFSEEWASEYFTECQATILANTDNAIRNDSKVLNFHSFPAAISVGQLVIWDSQVVLNKHEPEISKILQEIIPNWFMNLVSVGENKSYFITSNTDVQKWLSQLLKVSFSGSIATADRLWLRKEIIQEDILNTTS